MRYLIFIGIVFLTWFRLIGQTIQFADKETKTPVAFASIKTGNQIFYSNIEGQAEKRYFNKAVYYQISCIGYETKKIKGPIKVDSIYLTMKAVELPTVEIKPEKERKSIELGYHKKRTLIPETYVGHDSLIIAAYIPSLGEQSQIKEIIYSLKNQEKSQQFIAFLFEVNAEGKPGLPLFHRLLSTDSLDKKGRLDISNEYIYIPVNGLFVGFGYQAKKPKENYGYYNMYGEVEIKIADSKKHIAPTFAYNRFGWQKLDRLLPRFGLSIYK